MKKAFAVAALCAMALLSGCASYTWGTSLPADYRTVSVPVFENMTEVSELGPMVSQYTLREFQREGTFRVTRPSDAAIEVQGVLKHMSREGVAYDRGRGMRVSEYRYTIVAEVTFIDKRNGKVLLDRKAITGETTFLTNNDLLTGQKNAAARIANDIARQVVNEALALNPGDRSKGVVEGVQK